jgi:hypothetical protein
MKGGVYAYRTRKPGAHLRLPLLSYHWGYVGRTNSFRHRDLQHLRGGGQFNAEAKPWADLEPRCYRLRLPNWRWLQATVEALVIWALWPVYNVSLNRHNPRRIPLKTARWQRRQRDLGHRWPSIQPAHIMFVLAVTITVWILIARWA